MNSEKIMTFLQEHCYIASVLIGTVILFGAIRDWNWLCDPIVVSIWEFVLKLK